MTETLRATPGDATRQLVEQWRKRARQTGHVMRMEDTEEHKLPVFRAYQQAITECADDLEAALSSEAEALRPHPVLLEIAGLVNSYHNDGSTRTAGETLAAIARALGEPMSMEAPRRPALEIENARLKDELDRMAIALSEKERPLFEAPRHEDEDTTDGSLGSTARESRVEPEASTYDPQHTVTASGLTVGELHKALGELDQQATEERQHLHTFGWHSGRCRCGEVRTPCCPRCAKGSPCSATSGSGDEAQSVSSISASITVADTLKSSVEAPRRPAEATRSATIRFWHDRASHLRDALVDITDAEECPEPRTRAAEALAEYDAAFTLPRPAEAAPAELRERLLRLADWLQKEGRCADTEIDTDAGDGYRDAAQTARDAAAALQEREP